MTFKFLMGLHTVSEETSIGSILQDALSDALQENLNEVEEEAVALMLEATHSRWR